MPFNSNYNTLKDTVNNDESFHKLKNNYNIAQEGYTTVLQPQLMYKAVGQNNSEYVKAGIMSHQPQYNMDEMKKIDGLHNEVLEGEGIGRVFKKASRQVKHVANKTEKIAKKTGKTLKDSTVNKKGVIHQVIVEANNKLIPLAGEALGTAVGTAVGTSMGNPILGASIGASVGKSAGKVGRDTLKNETGYGMKKNLHDVDLNKVMQKYVKHQAQDLRRNVPTTKRVGNVKLEGGRSKRNIIVKEIMKEKNFSLPQASKYVKENNLF
jgi:outer membrane lipoprotein SlyB